MSEELSAWRSCVEGLIAQGEVRRLSRVVVMAQAGSTQDAAWEHAAGRPGLLVLAGEQSRGRGRLGRSWVQQKGAGVAATFVLDARGEAPGRMSLAAGLAAARAVEECLPPSARSGIALRWPNDVVERGSERKVVGVLVEIRGPLALIGIGVNVAQEEDDWATELQGRAVSLRAMGSGASRLDVINRLVVALDRVWDLSPEGLVDSWRERDVLVGTRRSFLCAGRVVSGMVLALEPTTEVTVQDEAGCLHRLPALATSLLPKG